MMKIKLDENLPESLALMLSSMGHDVDTIRQEGLVGRDDPQVWDVTQRSERFLITQDLDFSDVRRFIPGTHKGLLLIRLHEPGRLALARRVEQLFLFENVESWAACVVVATDLKVRIRRK